MNRSGIHGAYLTMASSIMTGKAEFFRNAILILLGPLQDLIRRGYLAMPLSSCSRVSSWQGLTARQRCGEVFSVG